MGTFQQFITNLGNMTINGKSGFWIICGAILLLVLVYMFSPKIRKLLGKAHLVFLIIPVLLLALGAYAIVSTNMPAPAPEKTEDEPAYDLEVSKEGKNSITLEIPTDLTDAETGEQRVEKFRRIKASDNLSAEAELAEDYVVQSADEDAELVFHPDGTWLLRIVTAEGEEPYEDTGKYEYQDKLLTLRRDRKVTAVQLTRSELFWQNMRAWFNDNLTWFILGCVFILALALAYLLNTRIRSFLKKHPLIWLIIPAFLLIYFVYVAIGWNVWVSVSDWPDGQVMPTYGWGGFGQYAKMFDQTHGPNFWNAVKNTLLLFSIIPICLLLGLGIALVMDHGLRGTSVFRTLILLPFALSFVVTGAIWQQMYRGDNGILLKFFGMFGIDTSKVLWLNPDLVMLSVMIVMIWQFSGYVAVIFLAAIKNVPTNIINAAKLDGAYMPRIYWKMVIPQLKGAMGSCITILAMYALRSFDLIVSLTSETNTASQTLPVLMYFEGFSQNNYAYAAAISCFLLALVLVLILPLTYLTNRRK